MFKKIKNECILFLLLAAVPGVAHAANAICNCSGTDNQGNSVPIGTVAGQGVFYSDAVTDAQNQCNADAENLGLGNPTVSCQPY